MEAELLGETGSMGIRIQSTHCISAGSDIAI